MSYSVTKPVQTDVTESSLSGATFNGKGSLGFKNNSSGGTPSGNTINVSGNAIISGVLDNSEINGDTGDNNIDLKAIGSGNTVHGKEGNDTIKGSGSLYGDEGEDNISGSGLLVGGAGNDTISADSTCHTHDIIQYNSGDGTDQITGFGNNDRLDVNTAYKVNASGSNVVVSVNGGKITYINPGKKFIHLDKSGNKTYLLNGANNLIKPKANFTTSAEITGNGTAYLYNEAHDVTIDGGKSVTTIYNDDRSDRTSIKAYSGVTVEDHSALAAIDITNGASSINLDDYCQYYDKSSPYSNAFDYTLKGSGSNLTLTITDAFIKKTKKTKIDTAEISPAINIVDDSNVGKKNDLEIISDGLIKGGKADSK